MNEIILRNGNAITLSQTAEETKSNALALARLVTDVESPLEQEQAVLAQQRITLILKEVEAQRVELKKPIIQAGKSLDDTVNKFKAELVAENERISGAVCKYQAALAAKAKLEAERAQREREAIEAEARAKAEAQRVEAERLAREEQARIAAEAKAKAAAAKSAADKLRIEQQAKEQAEQADYEAKRKADAAALVVKQQTYAAINRIVAPVEIPKAAGQSVRTETEITVLDIHALYQSNPACVKLEPRIDEIKRLVKAGVTLKGIKVEEVLKSRTTNKTVQPIDV